RPRVPVLSRPPARPAPRRGARGSRAAHPPGGVALTAASGPSTTDATFRAAAFASVTPRRLARVNGILLLALAASIVAAAALGPVPLDWRRALDPSVATPDAVILFRTRVPRVLLAAIVGGALATAGAALQALLRNPLADPHLLGVSSGA